MTSPSLTEVLRETLALFERAGEPRTTTEVAEVLNLGRRSTYERLQRLVEHGRLETKKVGGNGRVWWRPEPNEVAVPDWSATAESLIEDVLASAEVGIFVLDEDFEVVWINDATERYFGLDRERVLGRDKRGLVEEQIAPIVEEGDAFTEIVQTTYDRNTDTEQFECHVLPAGDREERWLEHRSKPIESGAYAGGRVELYYDVTDRKQVKQAHVRDRSQFESVIDAVEEYAIFMLDPDGHVRTWNQGAERIKGYTAEEILGEHFSRFYPEEAREAGVPQECLATAAEQGSVDKKGWRLRADGSRFWASVTITAIPDENGDIDGYVKVTHDLTERRETKRQIKRERNLLEQVQETSPVGIGIFDTAGDMRRANQRFMELLGRSDDESVEYTLGEQPLLDADGNELPYSERPAPLALSTGEPITDQRIRIDGQDGRTRWLSVNAKPFEGETDGVIITMTDITQLKEQAQRLERQRDDLRNELEAMFKRIDDAFVSLDSNFRFTYVNEQASELLETPSSALVGEHLWDVLEPGPKAETAFEEALETQESISFEDYYEHVDAWFENRVYASEDGLSVYFRDVTERKRREAELRTSKERYQTLFESIDQGFCTVEVLFDEDDEPVDYRFLETNPAFETQTGLTDVEGKRMRELVPDHEDHWFETYGRVASTGEPERSMEKATHLSDRWYEVYAFRIGQPAERKVAILFSDITDRKRFEDTLLALYESAQTLLDAETVADVDAMVVEAVADVINLPGVVVYRYDEEAEVLYPAAQAVDGEFMRGGKLPTVPPDDSSITGHVFANGAVRSFADITESPHLQTNATEMQSGLFVPMDDHGVLIAGTPEKDGIDDNSRRLVELLATNAEAAYNRVEREVTLQKHRRELKQQRESLAALNNLNEVVHDITEAVIEQSTREEIERTVCNRLADSESYLFAWIGDVDTTSQTVNLREEAGVDGYLDGITISVDPDDERSEGPTGRALRTGETQVTQDIRADSRHDPWREYIEQYGFRSSAAIPIVHEGTTYGVINVYADRPNAFDSQERAVISQLGEVVGHAIAAAERKQALMSDELVELEFQIEDVFGAYDIQVETDDPITLDHAVPVADEEFLVYGSVAPDGIDTVRKITESLPHWRDLSVRSEGVPTRFQVRIADLPVLSDVASLGGYVEQAVIEGGDYQITIHITPNVDVRRVTDAIQGAYSNAKMLRRRQISRARDESKQQFQRHLMANLTDRQQTSLEAAYMAGFFEWPRDISGEEVAESIGVAPPTFHQHLRKAERKVFDAVFSAPIQNVE